jgi:hypothetical protein
MQRRSVSGGKKLLNRKFNWLSLMLLGALVPQARAVSTYTCTAFPVGDRMFHAGLLLAPEVVAASVNNQGQMAGIWQPLFEFDNSVGFFVDRTGQAISRGTNGLPTPAVNNLGQLAGWSFTGLRRQAFVSNADGSVSTFDPPNDTPDQSFSDFQVSAINDKGDVLGSISAADSSGRVSDYRFIRDAGGQYALFNPTPPNEENLVRYGGFFNGGINNAGTAVVGNRIRYANGSEEPARTRGTLTNWNTLFWGINNPGTILGQYVDDSSDSVGIPAFIVTPEGNAPIVTCPDPSLLRTAYSINDSGVIAGEGRLPLPDGDEAAVILATPTGLHSGLKLSNADWQFAAHAIGQTSGTGTIYLTSNGVADLNIRQVRKGARNADDSPGDFNITKNTFVDLDNELVPEVYGSIALTPHQFCAITFNFTPSAAGLRTAEIVVYDDAPDAPHIIRLSGTGLGKGNLELSNNSWTFASHPIGEASGVGKIYIYNSGTEAINFSSVAISGTNSSDFAITSNTCGANLGAYKACAVEFQFTPIEPGHRRATLTLADDSATSTQAIPLEGYGN